MFKVNNKHQETALVTSILYIALVSLLMTLGKGQATLNQANRYLLVQSHQSKHQNNVFLFKVNKKDARTTPLT